MTEQDQIYALMDQMAILNQKLDALTTAFVSKLQWKQLDTLREGEITTINTTLAALSTQLSSLALRVTALDHHS